MKKNSSNTNLILLVTGFVMVLLISYPFTIKKTIDLKNNYKKEQQRLKYAKNADKLINTLVQENVFLDSILKVNDLQVNASFQQLLLNKITKYTQDTSSLKLTSLSSPHKFESKQIKETYVIEVQGSFTTLLSFLHYLENQRLGEVTSITFIKNKNYRKNTFELFLKIYLQKVKTK
ncbi:hypothetical protein V1T75_02440 [Tenacibaculum sp. FZY0031]|uniref:hypothetical protein n=1 Tax=Tenacibaculum sp. FZY0031 TaxID=3116648 RepID=UPI002EC76522|nr:hypothetical protein [Tenacibaculum sp. FZY0031]